MQALSALTPPLLVCAVVIIAIVAFLRHEMARSRADRSAPGDEGDLPAIAGSVDPDEKQNKLTDTSRSSAGDSGPVSRRLP
jgi:hypothetical protein